MFNDKRITERSLPCHSAAHRRHDARYDLVLFGAARYVELAPAPAPRAQLPLHAWRLGATRYGTKQGACGAGRGGAHLSAKSRRSRTERRSSRSSSSLTLPSRAGPSLPDDAPCAGCRCVSVGFPFLPPSHPPASLPSLSVGEGNEPPAAPGRNRAPPACAAPAPPPAVLSDPAPLLLGLARSAAL